MGNPLGNIGHDRVEQCYADRAMGRLSDLQLLELAIDRIARPKRRISSYSLHVGMEALARFGLLAQIPGDTLREAARKQVVAMVSAYERLDEDIPVPELGGEFADPERHLEQLLEAIAAGDVDEADKQACILGRTTTLAAIVGPFTDRTLALLGAAGHAPIFSSLALRAGPALPSLRLLPGVARSLAEQVDKQVRFEPASAGIHSASVDAESIRESFEQALLSAPRIGAPKSGFIAALVEHAMADDVPARAMTAAFARLSSPSGLVWHAAIGGLVGGAARVMIDELEDHAKYYWSHCLTIPQGIWALGPVLGDRSQALRVASVMALGFRSTRGGKPIDGALELAPIDASLDEALTVGPREAAAVAYHTPTDAVAHLREQLAGEASLRNDAHLVKYVLACLDCARMDPARAPLFHAAAAYLTGVWVREVPAARLHEHLHDPNRAAF